mgnify:CR=1 FL=1
MQFPILNHKANTNINLISSIILLDAVKNQIIKNGDQYIFSNIELKRFVPINIDVELCIVCDPFASDILKC